MRTNYASDKPEPVYQDGKCIGHIYPSLGETARKLLPAPKHRVPHLRLVTVKGRRT